MNKIIKQYVGSLLFMFALLLPAISKAENMPPISGHNLDVSTILPGDVLARANLVLAEINLIRIEVGKVNKNYQPIKVINAEPREVYFQALALYTKSDRLTFETTGFAEENQYDIDVKDIKPFHVWNMVNNALLRVQKVKNKLKIPERSIEIRMPDSTRPDQVFSAINNANRQINDLLSKRFSATDVFQQVTTATNVMAQLLATFHGVERIPVQDDLERRKTPSEVYQRLQTCYKTLREISVISGGGILKFDKIDNKARIPSDVYDLTSLLVANIEYLHSKKVTIKESAIAYYPGEKIPSHVFQRVSILQKQLDILLNAVRNEPDWLKS